MDASTVGPLMNVRSVSIFFDFSRAETKSYKLRVTQFVLRYDVWLMLIRMLWSGGILKVHIASFAIIYLIFAF